MSKYADKEKLAAVKDYLSGDIGFSLVEKRRGIDPSSLRRWIAAFRAHGTAGLKTKGRHQYSTEIRLAVLKRMREDQLSYRQAAAIFDIRNFNIIGRWERQYDEGGLIALSGQSTQCAEAMQRPKTPRPEPNDDDEQSRQELLDELNLLRMENAYLKKLDALVRANKKLPLSKERK